MADCINALKEWTGKARVTIIYDSTIDEFTFNGLFEKIKGKRNVAVVGFTTDGDVFGGFYNVAVTDQYWKDSYDPNIFAFSFESHGRCKTPQRFNTREEMKQKESVNVGLTKSDIRGFIYIMVDYVVRFIFGNEKSRPYCCNMSRAFEGLEDTTLTGQNSPHGDWSDGLYHHYSRLVAVRLE